MHRYPHAMKVPRQSVFSKAWTNTDLPVREFLLLPVLPHKRYQQSLKAFDHSLYLLGAFDDDKLVGFVRCVGDGEHILLVQDLIVDRAYQKQGIGTTLFKAVWDKYKEVRMFQVNTDLEDEVDNRFYISMGMKPLEKGHMISYFR